MPCLIGCLALSMPRLAIVIVVIFSDYIGHAFDSFFWPLLGFFLMPTATLAYAFAINQGGGLEGIYLAVFIIAVLVDVGIIGGNARHGRRYRDYD